MKAGAKERLLKKRVKLQAELEKNILLSSEGFKATDIFLGIFTGLLGIGICFWIPVVGWILTPIIVIACPFIGTHLRQENSKKEVKKLKEELENISIILKE
jgi:hypothetical protein